VDDVLEDERTGLLFDCGDWDGAAAKVVRLLDEPPLRSRLAGAARLASLGFSWARTAAAVEKACYAAMGTSRRLKSADAES
jgi:glycosyltransferase involved in cell wall biosynthesis